MIIVLFWVFDERLVVWNHFAGDGSWVARERCDDASIAKLCVLSFDAVWERAITHEHYRPARRAPRAWHGYVDACPFRRRRRPRSRPGRPLARGSANCARMRA